MGGTSWGLAEFGWHAALDGGYAQDVRGPRTLDGWPTDQELWGPRFLVARGFGNRAPTDLLYVPGILILIDYP